MKKLLWGQYYIDKGYIDVWIAPDWARVCINPASVPGGFILHFAGYIVNTKAEKYYELKQAAINLVYKCYRS